MIVCVSITGADRSVRIQWSLCYHGRWRVMSPRWSASVKQGQVGACYKIDKWYTVSIAWSWWE